MRHLKIISQIGIFFAICLIGEIIAIILPIPFPSSVISMVIAFIFLFTKILKPDHVQQKADFLLQNMAFFFIPAGVEIMNNFDFIKDAIVQIIIICSVSLVLTFAATAYTVTLVIRFQQKRKEKIENAGSV